jgi:LAO/AO transport system kinase
MADLFVLLLAPAGGDELQGVKRGIMEMADLILINKADGDLKSTATRTCADYAGALRLLRKRSQDPEDFPKALTVSALEGAGLRQSWEEMQALVAWRRERGVWARTRASQNAYWFNAELRHALLTRLEHDPEAAEASRQLQQAIHAGDIAPSLAAEQVVDIFLRPKA